MARWLRYFKGSRGFRTNQELAQALGVTEPHIVTILNRRRDGGLDFVLALHRVFRVETDRLLFAEPPTLSGDLLLAWDERKPPRQASARTPSYYAQLRKIRPA